MPIFAAAALPFTMSAIGAGAAATGQIVGAHKQASSQRKALDYQDEADRRAEALEREQIAEERRRFDIEEQNRAREAQIAEEERLWNRDRLMRQEALEQSRYDTRQANLAPYREASLGALTRLGDLINRPNAAQSPSAWQFQKR